MTYSEERVFAAGSGRSVPDAADIVGLFDDAADEACRNAGWGKKELLSRGLLWVKAREYVKIERLPLPGEKLTVTTYTLGSSHLIYPRVTEIRDRQGELVASGDCQWVIVSAASRTLAKASECGVVQDGPRRRPLCAAPFAEASLGEKGAALRGFHGGVLPDEFTFVVRSEYTDHNGHMNNRMYLRLCTDRAVGSPEEYRGLQLLVEYRKETFPEDVIRVTAAGLKNNGAMPASFTGISFEGRRDGDSIFRLQLLKGRQPADP